MQYKTLGNTDCRVSVITLGSMTWGEQNTQSEAFDQLDYAVDHGVNFIDTAEMYAVPAKKETYGLTETIIGNWLKQRNNRENLVIATKVTGPCKLKYIRQRPNLDRESIRDAITKSLQRLQTDYIDLYQLHWPSRSTNFFGTLNYQCNDELGVHILETLQVLNELVQEGLIRHIGVSNETAWGVMKFLELSEKHNLPKIVSIQNPYNLLNRSFEVGLAEVCWREKVSLLAYSPLAFGALSGKYLHNNWPKNARLTLFKEFSRYAHPKALAAIDDYVQLAKEYNLSPTQMSLAFVNQQPFVAGNIIGATSMQQLQENIQSIHVVIEQSLYQRIGELSALHSNPCP